MIKRIGKWLLIAMLSVVVAGITGWSVLFLLYSNLPYAPLRMLLAALFGLGTIVAFVKLKNRWRTLLAFGGVFVVLLIWFIAIPASNDRPWQLEVAILPTATVKDNLVTIRNIRNLDYRTEKDFTVRYYDKTFDLNKLESIDLICVYWGSDAIAHIMISFGFGGNDFVAFSIETRMQKGQAFSTTKGFFKNFALICIASDERDVIRVRTNYRDPREQTYIYRHRLPIENQRLMFLDYVETINDLAVHPAFYNTLDDNCATGAFHQARAFKGRGRFNWKILLSGYAAEYMYEVGMLDSSIPFPELRARSLVNAKAEAADQAEDFSVRIREGLPLPKPMTMQEFMPE